MQVQPTSSSPLANLTAQQPSATARLVSGDTTGLPIGALLAGTVTRLDTNEVTLAVAGKSLTIRTGLTVGVGDALAVTIAPNGQLEVARPTPPVLPTAAAVAVPVDEAAAIVNEILRQEKPVPLGESLPALRVALGDQPQAARVAAVLDTMLPGAEQSTSAEQLTALVRDGGQFLEAKLERRAAGEGIEFHRDLKAVLAQFLEVAPQVVAARTTLDGIEYQQAANALAQPGSGAFVVPIPFPDGAHWRTLHLAIEPESEPENRESAEPSNRYRLLMHVPLSTLGETYVEAGVDGDRVRAVLYLDSAGIRDRLRAELSGLETELRASGFQSVLLDIQPLSEMPDGRKARADAMQTGRVDRTSVVDVRV